MEIDIALGLVIHPRERRILIARRPENVHLAGFWEFPGGKVVANETAEDAVVREVKEETGLTVTVWCPMLPVVHTYPERTVRLKPFLCRASADDAQPKASTEVRWISFDEIMDIPFPAANRSIVEEFAKLVETVDSVDDL